jgi:hypothetical protein
MGLSCVGLKQQSTQNVDVLGSNPSISAIGNIAQLVEHSKNSVRALFMKESK